MLKTKNSEETKINAFLGSGTNFKGTLVFDGLVRIDGSMEGNIKTDDILVLSESSKVKADIEVGIAKISGTVTGNITAKEKVELYKPANITGIIKAPLLFIEEGVILNGTVEMSKAKTTLKEVKGEKETIDRSKLENE
jgi:cytoskeletal protein CcmA (bactofilin family)